MNQRNVILLFVLLQIAIYTGCSANKRLVSNNIKSLSVKDSSILTPSTDKENHKIKEPVGDITLKQTLNLVLSNNPELAVFSWEIREMDAKRLQAGLMENPELDIEVENFAGTGELEGTKSLEMTLSCSQLIELGNKRSKREQIAELEKKLSEWDYETKKLDVFTEANEAFIDVLTAQERLSLAEEVASLAEQLLNTVSDRVEAGKVSPVDRTKAELDLSVSKIELKRAKKDLLISKENLALFWGSSEPLFKRVTGKLESISKIPSEDQLNEYINRNPDLARWVDEIEKSKAEVKYAKSGSIPDLTLSAGYKRVKETNDRAFLIGASFPLQIYNRNKEEIQIAEYSRSKTKQKYRAEEIKIRTSLSNSYKNLSTAFSESMEWKNSLIPGAHKIYDAVNKGYVIGKFGLLDVLDAERTLFEIRSKYIDSLAVYHKEIINIERLIGIPLSSVIETEKQGEK